MKVKLDDRVAASKNMRLIFSCTTCIPEEQARSYIEAARSLLQQAGEELELGDVRQAAEKPWGAAALAVKAYASWREERRLHNHVELWEYMRNWLESWAPGYALHGCMQRVCMSVSIRVCVAEKTWSMLLDM